MDYEYILELRTESIRVGCGVLAYVTNAGAVNAQLTEADGESRQ